MILEAVGTLFPAIPLAIAALNFRYTSLAGLIRNIFTQIEAVENRQAKKGLLLKRATGAENKNDACQIFAIFRRCFVYSKPVCTVFLIPVHDKYSIRVSGEHHYSPYYKR